MGMKKHPKSKFNLSLGCFEFCLYEILFIHILIKHSLSVYFNPVSFEISLAYKLPPYYVLTILPPQY